MHITPRIQKRYWSKVKLFWNAVTVGFQTIWLTNMVLNGKNGALWDFQENQLFFWYCVFSQSNVGCHWFWTSPRQSYCHCDNFHQTIFCKIVQDKSLWNVKDCHYHNLGYVWKIIPCGFFQNKLKILKYKKSETYTLTELKKRSTYMTRIFYYNMKSVVWLIFTWSRRLYCQ